MFNLQNPKYTVGPVIYHPFITFKPDIGGENGLKLAIIN